MKEYKEVTKDEYEYYLSCVPPVYLKDKGLMRNVFAVGEVVDFRNGQDTYQIYFQIGDKYYTFIEDIPLTYY